MPGTSSAQLRFSRRPEVRPSSQGELKCPNYTEIEIASPAGLGGGSSASAVSWGAIIAGAVAAAATTLLMVMVTTGLGFAAVSPYPNSGVSATTFTLLTAAWLIGVHALASSVGGYIAGRLRTRWTGLHTDEVFFRDTRTAFSPGRRAFSRAPCARLGADVGHRHGRADRGHGFGPAAQGAMQQSGGGDASTMMLDRMFRSDRATPDANDQNARAEVGRIMASAIATGNLPQDDKTYAAQVIPAALACRSRTPKSASMTQSANAKATAEKARKGAMYASLWSVIALLIGALCASAFAAYAGQLRDD